MTNDEAINDFYVEQRRTQVARIEALEQALRDADGLLAFIERGFRSGHVKDVSIVPKPKPDDTECDLTSLSTMVRDTRLAVRAALAQTGEPTG